MISIAGIGYRQTLEHILNLPKDGKHFVATILNHSADSSFKMA
jgi:hypothetical protein